MPVNHAIWNIDDGVSEVEEIQLETEEELEDIIHSNSEILNDNWIIIGRQVMTDYNQYIDLLAMDHTGSVIII